MVADPDYWCPRYQECEDNLKSIALGPGPSYVSLVSSSLSCIGSLLIVYAYLRWPDVRSGSRSIITFLSIADFFTAFGYIIGSINYIVHFGELGFTPQCVIFQTICSVQSFITTWSSLSSFLWTSALAFYLYLTVVHGKVVLAQRLIPIFHIVNWGLPIVICLPLLFAGKLGFAPYATSNWCYIRDDSVFEGGNTGLSGGVIGLILVAGKAPELLTYLLVVVLYVSIKIHIKKETKQANTDQYLSANVVEAIRKVDQKLTFIPIMFVLLRMWGTIQFFYSIIVTHQINENGCVSTGIKIGFLMLGYLQAIGDGGQGWGNTILYVFASVKIRKRLFGWCYVPLCRHCLQAKRSRSTSMANQNTPLFWHRGAHAPNLAQHNGPQSNRAINISVESGIVHYKNVRVHVQSPLSAHFEPTTTFSDESS